MSIFKLRTMAALSWAVLLACACGPTPATPSIRNGEVGKDGAIDDNGDAGRRPEPEQLAQTIGRAGGTLKLKGLVTVEVPKDALVEDIELSAREVAATDLPAALPAEASADAVELMPHGQLFDRAVTIRLTYDQALASEQLVVLRLDDPNDLDWEVVEGATFKNGVATILSTTFSFYTVYSFPEPICNNPPTATAACSGACTPSQYCSSANTCTAIAQTKLCANTSLYAVHGGEMTVDDPAADTIAAALATACGLTVKTASLSDSTLIHPCTSEPLVGGGNTLFLAGSLATNLVLRNLDRTISPVFIDTDGTKQLFKTRAGTKLVEFDPASITPSHDYFLIQIFPDTRRGALIISAFGREGPGTKAAAWYFANRVVPTLESRTWTGYLVVEWQDSGDGKPNDADTFTVRASEPLPAPPPTVETPYASNASGTLRVNQSLYNAAGYKFTPQVNGKVTALGGYFNGTKTVKLFRTSDSALLASARVSASNAWTYKDITPVALTAGTQYTVAVYLAGSGGAKRSSTTPALPYVFGSIRIDVPTQVSTLFSPNAVPTTDTSPSNTMTGLADIKFLKN